MTDIALKPCCECETALCSCGSAEQGCETCLYATDGPGEIFLGDGVDEWHTTGRCTLRYGPRFRNYHEDGTASWVPKRCERHREKMK